MRAAGQRATAGPVGCLGHLKIVYTSDVLDDAVAGVVPDVHAESEVCLGFHGQVRLDSSWPADIYTPCCCVLSEVKNGR